MGEAPDRHRVLIALHGIGSEHTAEPTAEDDREPCSDRTRDERPRFVPRPGGVGS
ncbi:hypothetical protein GCM10023108_43030 [Saccharopolyspora hordei]